MIAFVFMLRLLARTDPRFRIRLQPAVAAEA